MIALKSFGELVMRHKGARICVMAGGPSLAADIERVEADLWISCNAHGARLRRVDYVVAMDNLHTVTKEPMEKLIREHTKAPIIGPWHWCDYGITNYPLSPRLMLTGVIAPWMASMMGAHPVIMAGFDCYGSTARSIGQHRDYVPHIQGAVRVVSGPLVRFWPAYDPAEVLPAYVAPDVFSDELEHGVTVKLIKPVSIRGRDYPVGTVLRVPKAEVWRQIKHRSIIEVEAPRQVPAPRQRKILTLAKEA